MPGKTPGTYMIHILVSSKQVWRKGSCVYHECMLAYVKGHPTQPCGRGVGLSPFRGAPNRRLEPQWKAGVRSFGCEETSCFDLSTARQTPQLHTTAVLMCWGHSRPSPPLQGGPGGGSLNTEIELREKPYAARISHASWGKISHRKFPGSKEFAVSMGEFDWI